MADNKKAAGKKPAAPKKVFFTAENQKKYEVVGKRFLYLGDTFTAEEASKNKELMEKLIKNNAPAIVAQ